MATVIRLRTPNCENSRDKTPDKLDLRIDGSIDLGSSWNVRNSIHKFRQGLRQNRDKGKPNRLIYQDNTSAHHPIDPTRTKIRHQKKGHSGDVRPGHKSNTSGGKVRDSERQRLKFDAPKSGEGGIVGYTQFWETKTTDHKVKDVGRTNEFTVHLFKQTMQVFDSIKRKMGDEDMKDKIDDMARSYRDQFGDFVRQQRETAVRTEMGDQRAILHTMETSNMILQRLVNFLKADMDQVDIGRSRDNTLQREVDAARQLEYKHVCSKYGYCRTDHGFTAMLRNCVKILLTVDDEKMYQARDAITEVLKTADYTKFVDSKVDKDFKKKINSLEKKDPEDIRLALRIFLAILSHSQTPLVVNEDNSEVVKKTAAFYTFLAMWEDVMPADETNTLEWADIEKSLTDWAAGKRGDVFEIMKALEKNIRRGYKKIDPDKAIKMKEQIKIMGS